MARLAGDTGILQYLKRGHEFHLEQSSVMDVVILICGHGNRDQRCGIMGPLLQAEFEEKLPNFGIEVKEGQKGTVPKHKAATASISLNRTNVQKAKPSSRELRARVGLISHIGGHKWAGNVIIYFPKFYKGHVHQKHPLRGKGIWYGRVEPWHVEGIIEQTIMEGRVIKELFRGGMPGVRLSKEGELKVEQDEVDDLSIVEHMR